MEVSLCSVHVPGGFSGRAGLEVSGDCVFLPGCAGSHRSDGRQGWSQRGYSQTQVPARASPRLHTSCHPIVEGTKAKRQEWES